MEKIEGLFLYIKENGMSYLDDWKDAFAKSDKFNLRFYEISNKENFGIISKSIQQLDKDNIIILGHSCLRTIYNIEKLKRFIPVLLNRKCFLISFIGDELNLHNSPLKIKIETLKKIEPQVICTQLPLEGGVFLYSEIMPLKILSLPHALNEKLFKPLIELENRSIDIGIITVPYPIYLGDVDRELLFDKIAALKDKFNINVDIKKSYGRKSYRLNREQWIHYLNNLRATPSSEAGTFYLEKDDKTVFEIIDFLSEFEKRKGKIMIKSNNTFLKIRKLIPDKINKLLKNIVLYGPMNNFISYDTELIFDKRYFSLIYEKYYKGKIPNARGKAISSRHFDAIGTKTVQILVEGKYNDILRPNIHYIEVKRDFNNLEEVLLKLKDLDYCKKVVNEAYEYVIENHTYKHRLQKLYEQLIIL